MASLAPMLQADNPPAVDQSDPILEWMRASLDALIRLIEDVIPGMRGSVLLLDNDGVTLRHGAAPRLPEEYCRLIDGERIGPAAGSCGTAVYRKERVIVGDIASDPLWAPYRQVAEPFGLAACWSTPIIDSEGNVLGTFAMYYDEPRSPTSMGIALTDTATLLSANIIKRARVAMALRQREQELSSSHERLRAAVAASATSTWQWDVMTDVVDCDEGLYRLFGVDPAEASGSFELFVSRIHADDRERVIAAARRCAAEGVDLDEEFRIVWPDGSIRWAVDRARAVIGDDGTTRYMVGACVDVTERRMREEQFRALAESIPQLAWMADASGLIYWYNRRWYDYTGTTLEAMRGWGWTAVHHPDHVDRVTRRIQESWDSGEPWEDTFPLRGRDGEYRWFLSRAQPIRDADGRVVRWFGTNTDITERKRAEAEREQLLEREHEARESAERATRLRDEVMAVVAHDLRNPVHTIILSAGLMREIPLDEAQRDHRLSVIQRTAKGMDHLIRDLLDATRIESGTFAVRQARVHVRAMLDETVELFEGSATERGITICCEASDDIPPMLGDRDRLAQVLSNLIGNALKFTPAGGAIRVCASSIGDDTVEIRVADTGSGIPADQLEKVFDRFWQADRQGRAGAGLGLAIVKGIIEAHGGRIRVDSVVGEGSTFSFTVPVAPPSFVGTRRVDA